VISRGTLTCVSLIQLESFVAVAEEGHVGRAAGRLHVSQPPLTRRIQSLEADLGLPLFDRTTRGMRLRPAGETLLPLARDILARVDDFARQARNEGKKPSGQSELQRA